MVYKIVVVMPMGKMEYYALLVFGVRGNRGFVVMMTMELA
jgi:hypothetical protein